MNEKNPIGRNGENYDWCQFNVYILIHFKFNDFLMKIHETVENEPNWIATGSHWVHIRLHDACTLHTQKMREIKRGEMYLFEFQIPAYFTALVRQVRSFYLSIRKMNSVVEISRHTIILYLSHLTSPKTYAVQYQLLLIFEQREYFSVIFFCVHLFFFRIVKIFAVSSL